MVVYSDCTVNREKYMMIAISSRRRYSQLYSTVLFIQTVKVIIMPVQFKIIA